MARWLRPLGALLVVGVGAVHLQQYVSFIDGVPTVGVLFLLNSFAAGAVCLMLASPFTLAPAASGIALSVGSLISIAIARYAGSGLFDYREPTWRAPIVIAVVLEVAAVVVLAGLELDRRRTN
jgi:hypothetical protein